MYKLQKQMFLKIMISVQSAKYVDGAVVPVVVVKQVGEDLDGWSRPKQFGRHLPPRSD